MRSHNVLFFAVFLLLLALGADRANADERRSGSAAVSSPQVQNTGALLCQLDDGSRRFLLVFNEEGIVGSSHAVMAGLTDTPGRYRPPYGASAFVETANGISAEFKNQLPVDFDAEELVDDCYVQFGGRYQFLDLQRQGQRFRGRFIVVENNIQAPGKTCEVPEVIEIPEQGVECLWEDLALQH